MKLDSPRQWLALCVLFIAGMASLATTTVHLPVDLSVKGVTSIDPQGGVITGHLRLNAAAVDMGVLKLDIRPRESWDAAVPVDHVVRTGAVTGSADDQWAGYGATVDRSGCVDGEPCDVPFEIALSPRGADGPFNYPWTMRVAMYPDYSEAGVASGRAGSPTVSVTIADPGPDLAVLAIGGGALGVALGLLAVAVASRGRDAFQRARVLAVIAAATCALVAIALAQGAVAQGLSAWPAVAWLVGSAAILAATATPLFRRACGFPVALAMVGVPGMLVLFTALGAYRTEDAVLSFAGLGMLVVGGSALLALMSEGTRFVALSGLTSRSQLSFNSAVLLIALIGTWTLVVAAGVTSFSVVAAVVPLLALPLLAFGLWRWIQGQMLVLAIASLAIFILVPVGWAGVAVMAQFMSQRPPEIGLAAISLIVILVGGILMLVGGRPVRATESER